MLHRGAYSIVLSRRITDADGRFLGVVAGSIRFSYFHELFDRLNLDPDDTITVLRRDRTIIMRKPFDLDIIGKNLADRPNWNAATCQASGPMPGGPGRRDTRGSMSGAAARPALCRGRKAAGRASSAFGARRRPGSAPSCWR